MDGCLQAVPSTRVWPTDPPVRSVKGRWLLIKGPFLLFHGPCIFNPHPQTMFHIYCVPCFFPHSHIFSCGSSYFSMNRLPLRGALACPFGLILRAYETIADLWNQAFRIPSVLRPAIAFGVVFINIQSCLNMDFQWFSWIFCRMSLTPCFWMWLPHLDLVLIRPRMARATSARGCPGVCQAGPGEWYRDSARKSGVSQLCLSRTWFFFGAFAEGFMSSVPPKKLVLIWVQVDQRLWDWLKKTYIYIYIRIYIWYIYIWYIDDYRWWYDKYIW